MFVVDLPISGVVTQHDPTLLSGSTQGRVCILSDRAVVLLLCMSALEYDVGGSSSKDSLSPVWEPSSRYREREL